MVLFHNCSGGINLVTQYNFIYELIYFVFLTIYIKVPVCEEPPSIDFGRVVRESTAAFYTCEKGYDLHGPRYRLCQGNASWSGHSPYCRFGGSGKSKTYHILGKFN